MKYLNENNILEMGTDWNETVAVIVKATQVLRDQDYSQPVKPYLRYKDPVNRIIAMPAYLGGEFLTAGIKWIASFPGNNRHNIPRAHSVLILNDADTGVPEAIINTALVSGIRTASVSGAIIKSYLDKRPLAGEKINAGIIGYGPIGQLHLQMIISSFSESIDKIFIYDLNTEKLEQISEDIRARIVICDTWETVFNQADIFITCTVSSGRYINLAPPSPSLHLNVSLRDYQPEFMKYVDIMVVDNWEEVCRENTDIEVMHKTYGLGPDHVFSMDEIFFDNVFKDLAEKVVMFNPMGMAVYDMGIGKYFFDRSVQQQIGTDL